MCRLSLPAIRENYQKFDSFYHTSFARTTHKYTQQNFEEIIKNEDLDGFVCGSDTIFAWMNLGLTGGIMPITTA